MPFACEAKSWAKTQTPKVQTHGRIFISGRHRYSWSDVGDPGPWFDTCISLLWIQRLMLIECSPGANLWYRNTPFYRPMSSLPWHLTRPQSSHPAIQWASKHLTIGVWPNPLLDKAGANKLVFWHFQPSFMHLTHICLTTAIYCVFADRLAFMLAGSTPGCISQNKSMHMIIEFLTVFATRMSLMRLTDSSNDLTDLIRYLT